MDSLGYHAQRIIVVVYASVVNFWITAHLSNWLNEYVIWSFDGDKTKYENALALTINVAVIGTFRRVLRQISGLIPLPFTNAIDPTQVTAVKGSVLTGFTIFLFVGTKLRTFTPLFE